jgi:hypothetical protein
MNFSFMARFVDALKHAPFTGEPQEIADESHIMANCHKRVLGIRGQV